MKTETRDRRDVPEQSLRVGPTCSERDNEKDSERKGYSHRQLGVTGVKGFNSRSSWFDLRSSWFNSRSSWFNMNGILQLVVMVIMLSRQTQGEVYNTTRVEPLKHIFEEEAVLCVRPRSDTPPPEFVVQLEVQSTASDRLFTAGNSTLKELTVHEWHSVTIAVRVDRYIHVLNVTKDGQRIPFSKSDRKIYTSAFKFYEILIMAKGTIEVSDSADCPPAEDLPTEATTHIQTDLEGTPTMPSSENSSIIPVSEKTHASYNESRSTQPPSRTSTEATTNILTEHGGRPTMPRTSENSSIIPVSEKPPASYNDPRSTQAPSRTSTGLPDEVLTKSGSPWIWTLGSIGSIPALPLILGVLTFIVVISLILVCFHKKPVTSSNGKSERPYHAVTKENGKHHLPYNDVFRSEDELKDTTESSKWKKETTGSSFPLPEEDDKLHISNENPSMFKGYVVADYH